MSQYPSRLSRNELYSYGFKEGQPWGEDRRAMESALRAMDQLEREIQQNYIYNRTVPSNPWSRYPLSSSSSSSRPYIETTPRAYYHAQAQAQALARPPPDIRINRSNTSDTSQSESSSSGSEMAHWSGHQNEYGYPGYVAGQSGRPNRHYYTTTQDDPPAAFHRPSMARTSSQGRPGPPSNVYAPPLSASNSSYSQFRGVKGNFSEEPSFYHPTSPPASPHSPTHASQPFSPSGQMQLIRYKDEQDEHLDASHHSGTPPSSTNPLSPGWSMATTRGTGSENLSMGSSEGGAYSEEGYHPHISSSGHVESYNLHSHEGYRSSYLDYRDTVQDPDQDYMSDGVASDEGVYYSSSEGPEEEGDGEDVFSDGGYSTHSDDYDDSYGDSD